MTGWDVLTAVHAAATWYLVGLIWMIQVVHYPGFSDVDPARYQSFQTAHMARMGTVVGPMWLVEGITVLAVFIAAPDTTSRVLATIGGLLETFAIGVTIRASVPAHQQLSDGYDEAAHRRLVRTNWLRTVAWSGRGLVALALLLIA